MSLLLLHSEATRLSFLFPSQRLLCVSNISLFSICVPLPECLCLSRSDNTCFAEDPAGVDRLPPDSCFSCTAFGHITDLCSLSVLWIVGLNLAACAACDSPTEWLRGHHFQPVRDCRAALPCQPVIISTSRPLFFSVALSLAHSCSNRMITGC